jgi:subtilisin family serine protease
MTRVKCITMLWSLMLAGMALNACKTLEALNLRSGERESKQGADDNRPVEAPVGGDATKDHVILVLDDGFDLSHPVFASKVAGSYTIDCPETNAQDPEELFTLSFEQQKAAVIASLRNEDANCKLAAGINFRVNPKLQSIMPYRDRWNEQVKTKKIDPELAKIILPILQDREGNYDFHGTATAGTIAYQNPEVKLVLVQRDLGGPEGSRGDTGPALCPSALRFERMVSIFEDAEVRKVFIERDPTASEKALHEVVVKHGITLMNYSAGIISREAYLKKLAADKCPVLDIRKYWQTYGALINERERFVHKTLGSSTKYLTVQSAGNDGTRIDGFQDTFNCSDHQRDLMMVGATNFQGQTSAFSNFGNCVDVQTMGEAVVVAFPQGFLSVVDGTSFSAPVATRYIAKNFNGNTPPGDIIASLASRADANKTLPKEFWPAEIAYKDGSSQVSNYALSSREYVKPPWINLVNPPMRMRDFKFFKQAPNN